MQNRIKSLFFNHFFWLFVLCGIAFWQVSFLYSGLHWDMLDVHLPWLTFMSEVLQSGELHYWNPYQELGYPFHADMLSTWYPPALLTARFIGFDLIILQYYFLFHVFIAGCGMYKLTAFFNNDTRIAFLGAVSYMLCGVAVSNAQHLFIITSLAWIPFVLYYFLKTNTSLAFIDLLKLAVVSCFMITGGYPFLTVVAIYFLIALFLMLVLRRIKHDRKSITGILFLFASGALITGGMWAAMIIGLMQVLPVLERGTALSVETALSFPYTLNALWFSQVPFSLGNNWEYFGTDISMVNIYSGIILSVFMVYGLWKRVAFMEYVFFGFGIVCLLGALARELPLMKWMVTYIPLFNFFRFPALFRLFFIVGLIIFASGALRIFLNSFDRDKKPIGYIIVSFMILMIVLIIYGLAQADLHHLTFLKHHETLQHKLMELTLYERLFIGGTVQLIVLLAFLFILLKAKNAVVFSKNISILFVFDMFLAVQMNINYTVVDPVVDPIKVNNELQAIIPNGYPVPKRTSMVNAKNEGTGVLGIWRNVNNFTKEPAIDGFSSFWLNDYLRLEKDTMLGKMVLDNPIVYLSASVFPEEKLVAHKKTGTLNRKNIYLAKEGYQKLKSFELNHSPADTAYFLEFRPNKFRIKSISSGDQVLTILQSAYKGWRVTVAGKETNWFKSNYLFMSVLVPKGQSEIEFTYENPWIKNSFIGAAIVFFAMLLGIIFFTVKRRGLKQPVS